MTHAPSLAGTVTEQRVPWCEMAFRRLALSTSTFYATSSPLTTSRKDRCTATMPPAAATNEGEPAATASPVWMTWGRSHAMTRRPRLHSPWLLSVTRRHEGQCGSGLQRDRL